MIPINFYRDESASSMDPGGSPRSRVILQGISSFGFEESASWRGRRAMSCTRNHKEMSSCWFGKSVMSEYGLIVFGGATISF